MTKTQSGTPIGTICHGDDSVRDPNHRRLEIWLDDDGVLWADRDNPNQAPAPKAGDIETARDIARQLWSGPHWDLQLA